MGNAAGIRAGQAYYELGVKNGLSAGLKAAEAELKAWGDAVIKIGAGLLAFGTGLNAALNYAIDHFRGAVAQLTDVAQATGVGAQQLGEMQVAAVALGGSVEDVGTALGNVQRQLFAARMGSVDARIAFQRLGLSFTDLLAMSQVDRLALIGERIGQLRDPADRAAMAQQLLGVSGGRALQALTAGTGSWTQAMQRAREMGIVLSDEQVAAGKSLNTAWGLATLSVQGLWNKIGAALAPSMESLVKIVTDLVTAVTRWVDRNEATILLLDKIGLAATVAGGALIGLGTAMRIVGFAMAPIVNLAASLVSVLVSLASGTLNAVANIITGTVGLIYSGVSTAFGVVSTVVMGSLSAASAAASASLTALSLASAAASAAGGFVATSFSVLTGLLGAAWGAIMAVSTALVGLIAGEGGASAGGGILSTAWATAQLAMAAGAGISGALAAVLFVLGGDAAAAGGFIGVLGAAAAAAGAAMSAGAGVGGVFSAVLDVLAANSVLVSAAMAVLEAIMAVMSAVSQGATFAMLELALAELTAETGGIALVVAIGLVIIALQMLVGAAVAATLALTGGFVVAGLAIWYFWDEIKSGSAAAWQWVKDTAAAALDWLAGKFRWLTDAGSGAWSGLVSGTAAAWEGVTAAAGRSFTALGGMFGRLVNDMSGTWSVLNDSITAGNWKDALAVSWAALKLVWAETVNWLGNTWDDVIGNLGDAFGETWDAIVETAKGAWAGFIEQVRITWINAMGAMRLAAIRLDPLLSEEEKRRRAEGVVLDTRIAVGNVRREREGAISDAESERIGAAFDRMTAAVERDAGRREDTEEIRGARAELAAAMDEALINSQQAFFEKLAEQGSAGAAASRDLAPISSSVRGTFSGYALEGINPGGRTDPAERTVDAIDRSTEVLTAILAALRTGAVIG